MEKFQAKIYFNHLIAVMVVMSMLMTGVQLLQPNFFGMALVFIVYGIFTFGMISFIDAMSTLYFYKGKKIDCPIARRAGSLSYAISALLIGSLVEANTILTAQFFLFIPLLICILSIEKIKGLELKHDPNQRGSHLEKCLKNIHYLKFF